MNQTLRGRRKKRNIFKKIIIILVIIFFVLNYFKLQPINSITFSIANNALNIKNILLSPFDGMISYFVSKKVLYEENEKLIQEVENYKINILSTEILRKQYQSLLEQKNDLEESVEIAKVILKPSFSGFDSLVISGDFDDSKIGQKVFYKNIVLGEIVEINNKNAIVRLFSASGEKTPAKLKDGNFYEVMGRGNGQYEMILPKDTEVVEGDIIVYPEYDISLFGVVNKVFSTKDDLFNQILFNIPVDFSDIEFVRIGEPLKFVK